MRYTKLKMDDLFKIRSENNLIFINFNIKRLIKDILIY